jgi:hypothetical protein
MTRTKHCIIEHYERYEGKPFWTIFVDGGAVLTLRGPENAALRKKIEAIARAIDEAIDVSGTAQ